MPVIGLAIDARDTTRGMDQYNRAVAGGSRSTERLVGATNDARGALGGLEKKLIGAAAGVISISSAVYVLGKSIKIFADFDDQLRVAASYARATEAEFLAMADAAKLAGATTSKTATQAAQGLAEFASRGFTVKEQIVALTPAIRLAEAAQVDLGRATEVSAGILRGFGKDVSYLERINDVIIGISGASAANLSFVGEAAKYAIPAARAAGEEFETVAAILGTLADQQFQAGQSGNAVKNFLISLTGPTARAGAALDRLGVKTRDVNGKFLGLIPIFKQLEAANLDLTSSTQIFGRYFTTAGLAVTKTIDEVERDLGYLKTGIDGITESAAKFQQAGLGGQFRLLGSATESLYIAIGGQLAPIIGDVAGKLSELASNIGRVASATTGIVETIRALTNGFLGLYTAAQVATDGITGLLAFGVNISPLYRGLELIADGLEKIGAIDDNPFDDWRKSINDFADAQDGGLQRSEELISKVNKKFDEYRGKIEASRIETEKAAAAERNLAAAAESAGTAAGKQAIAAGKSVELALKAAEAGKKAYLIQAEASKKQEEADKKAASAAGKRKAAIDDQAKTVKAQALSFGATESAARAAADAIVTAGVSVDKISSGGINDLNASLDDTAVKADNAKIAIQGIGEVGLSTAAGGEIAYSVGLSTSDYDKKINILKADIKDINDNYIIKINANIEGAVALVDELENLEKQLKDTESIQGYNEQLRNLQAQYRAVHQEFLGGKLVIETDPAAAEAIRAQITAVNELKLGTDNLIPGLERVNGVWQQMPSAVAMAVEPTVASLGSLSNAAGEIETKWKLIDGVWKETLSDGTVLVEQMNGALSAGIGYADGFGKSVAVAAAAASGNLSDVEKILKKIETQIQGTQAAAGSLKFNQLAESTAALNIVNGQIKSLQKELKNTDQTTKEAQESIKKLLELQAVKDTLSTKISSLKKEIYETGKEAEKTGKKANKAAAEINKIPAATNKAAEAVRNLASANDDLANASAEAVATQGDIARAAWSASKTFTTTSLSNVNSINAEIAALKEEQQIIKDMNDIVFGRQSDFTGVNRSAQNLQQQEIQELDSRKFEIKMGNFFKNLGLTQDAFADRVPPSTVNNNFYGMDRSDALTVTNEAERMKTRL